MRLHARAAASRVLAGALTLRTLLLCSSGHEFLQNEFGDVYVVKVVGSAKSGKHPCTWLTDVASVCENGLDR